jgi:hypothetical protein
MGEKMFLAVELVSCLIPFSFDAIHYYTKIHGWICESGEVTEKNVFFRSS